VIMATYTDPDALDQLAEHIKLRRPNEVIGTDVAFGELTVTATASGILDLLDFLRSDSSCRFSTLVDITAVDYPSRQQRFDVVWHFLSMYQNHRIRVKVAIREDEMLPTLTAIYPAANWFEREIFPLSETRFFSRDVDAELSFEGQALSFKQGSRNFTGRRI